MEFSVQLGFLGFVSIWGVIWWFVSNFQSPFSGSTVVFYLLKLDFLVVQENFGPCSDWFILCLKRESESFEKKEEATIDFI